MSTRRQARLLSSNAKGAIAVRHARAAAVVGLVQLALDSRNQTGESIGAQRLPRPGRPRSDRDKSLNVRVPREIKLRLRRLKYQLDERDLAGNMAELVHMWLATLPPEVDEDLVLKLRAFRGDRPGGPKTK